MYTKENFNKDGKVVSYRFITSYKNPLTNTHKNISRTWTIPIELTSKKQIERELENQKVQFLKYVQNLSSGVYSDEVYQDITLKDLANQWLARILTKNEESQNHHQHAKHNLKKIFEFFKDIKMTSINKIMIDAFYTHLNTITYTTKKYIIKKSLAELKPTTMTHYAFFKFLGISEQTYKIARSTGSSIGESSYNRILEKFPNEISEYIEIKSENKKYAQATKQGIRLTLIAIFSYAKQLGIVEHNLADSTFFKTPVNGSVKEKKVLELNEFLNFTGQVRNLENPKHKAILTLLYTLGLRRCEAVGLMWRDIDFINKKIFIQRDAIHTTEAGTFTRKTKNKSSTRLLPMSDELVNTLLEFRDYWNEESYTMENPSEFLFRQKNGSIMFPDTVNTILENFLTRKNLPIISPHEIRHTFITIMVTVMKIPISIVGNFVGHNQLATTMNPYTHITDIARLQVSESLNDLFLENKSTLI